MSQTDYRRLDVIDHGEAYHQAEMAHNWEPKSIHTDDSGPLFTMYSNMTKHHNNKIKAQLDSIDNIVFFVRTSLSSSIPLYTAILQMSLFSAVAAALLVLTVPELKPSPPAPAALYLENMYKLQLLTNPNTSLSFTPTRSSQLPVPTNAILVNTLLLMSLCINIFLAFMALWIRGRVPRYLSDTESPQLSPHYRARMHEILSSEFYDSRAFVPLVLMLWLSPLFFFTGLSIYLFNISRVVFGAVLGCICLCFIAFFFILHWLDKVPARSKSSARVDDRVLDRLFEALVKDSDLVQFFEHVVDFCRSKKEVVDKPLRRVIDLGKRKVKKTTVKQFLERTRSSKDLLVPEKMRRLVACVNFADAVRLPDVASPILEDVYHWDLHSVLQHVDMDQFLKGQGHRGREKVGLCAQSIIACVLSNVQGRDERWVALAAAQLGQSKDVIESYLEHGTENVLLAILTHVTGQIYDSLKHNRKIAASAASILRLLSNFDVQKTLPEVQNTFIALWNRIEHHAPKDKVLTDILNDLFNLYKALLAVRGSQLSDPSPGSIPKVERHPTAAVPSHSTPSRGSRGPSVASRPPSTVRPDYPRYPPMISRPESDQPSLSPLYPPPGPYPHITGATTSHRVSRRPPK